MGLVEQIRTAQRRLGWTDSQLLERSGLTFDRTGLLRRLNGHTNMTADECEALADAIRQGEPDFRLAWPQDKKAS